ncbi:Uncharacterized protein FWK35_00019534, partial [Aphis craccivora]
CRVLFPTRLAGARWSVTEHETGRIAYGPTTTERCGRGFESSSSQLRVQPALSSPFDRAQSPITDVSMSGSCGDAAGDTRL